MITAKKRKELLSKINEVSLPLRTKKIFKSKYGLEDGIYKSNSEVGKKFKITGEAVRLVLIKVNNLIES